MTKNNKGITRRQLAETRYTRSIRTRARCSNARYYDSYSGRTKTAKKCRETYKKRDKLSRIEPPVDIRNPTPGVDFARFIFFCSPAPVQQWLTAPLRARGHDRIGRSPQPLNQPTPRRLGKRGARAVRRIASRRAPRKSPCNSDCRLGAALFPRLRRGCLLGGGIVAALCRRLCVVTAGGGGDGSDRVRTAIP